MLSGWVSDHQQAAELDAAVSENAALARTQKISYTEGAKRDSAAVERIYGDRVADRDRVCYAYRVALAAQVDAGKVMPPEAKALLELRTAEYHAEYNAAVQAANAAALNSIGDSMAQAAILSRHGSPSFAILLGLTGVNTTCY